MATYQVVTWRGIPAAVEARDAGEAVTRQLSERFQVLIDSAAMQLGLERTEAYLDQWSRSVPEERPGAAAEVADAVVAELESRFTEFMAQMPRPL